MTADIGKEQRKHAREAKRARIIAEIRRIAAENGGVPPGIQQFVRKSGIKRSGFAGIWARWPDAVRNAGLTPHPANPRLADDAMLAGIAEVARQLGRIPAESDLRVYRASGHYLPGQKAFARHFGSKSGLLRALKHWAAASAERADIAAMLAQVNEVDDPPPRVTGAVYLMKFGRYYKIGCSATPEQRFNDLQRSLPERARLLHIILTDDPYGIEAYWHRRFAGKCARGEWFCLTPEDVAAFRRRRFQ
jgi:hypothetical protein